ncbi:MAG: lecithin retinol acyltransferase family protein, partial [Synergistaceae bacterium]|nr:lecithin retinol acyltransferase family protein [Synergistaceae bacterium]
MAVSPKNGDVLRVNRGLYSHYGVYAADKNHVIHYTGATGPNDFNGIVRETSLDEFLNGSENFSVCTFP